MRGGEREAEGGGREGKDRDYREKVRDMGGGRDGEGKRETQREREAGREKKKGREGWR